MSVTMRADSARAGSPSWRSAARHTPTSATTLYGTDKP